MHFSIAWMGTRKNNVQQGIQRFLKTKEETQKNNVSISSSGKTELSSQTYQHSTFFDVSLYSQ